jgi:hypothetical protein
MTMLGYSARAVPVLLFFKSSIAKFLMSDCYRRSPIQLASRTAKSSRVNFSTAHLESNARQRIQRYDEHLNLRLTETARFKPSPLGQNQLYLRSHSGHRPADRVFFAVRQKTLADEFNF